MMPHNLKRDHAKFRDVISEGTKKYLKQMIASGQIFHVGKPVKIKVPRVTPPPKAKTKVQKKKRYRSIDEPWEAS